MITPHAGTRSLQSGLSTGELTPVPRLLRKRSRKLAASSASPDLGGAASRSSTVDEHRARTSERRENLQAEMSMAKLGAAGAVGCGLACLAFPGLSTHTRIALLLLSIIVAAFYGTVLLALQQHRGTTLRRLQSLTTTLEASLPAAVLIILATIENASAALAMPVTALYMAAFALVGMRHSALLVVYATLLGGVQYLVTYRFVLWPEGDGTLPSLPLGTVAWILFLGGLMAVSSQRTGDLAREVWDQYVRGKRLERELSRHVSRDVARAILRDDSSDYKPERRQVSVLFCDLRGFTFLCERERPEDVVNLLNTVFDGACRIIESNGGTVNKFLGDGLLALFGAPQEHPNHAYAAATSAIEIQKLVRSLRRQGGIWTHLAIGIGIDTGDVVAGPLGAQTRVEYTAIGSPVNRAARLQGFADRDRQRIILSVATAQLLPTDMTVTNLGEVELKGFVRAEPIFSLSH